MTSVSISADPFLCIGMAILILIIFIINIYTLVYWQHPEDKNQSFGAKFVIIMGFQLCAMTVLLLPVDVANNAGSPGCDPDVMSSEYCGGLNMFQIWEAMFCMSSFLLIVLIPFSTFYYEAKIGSEDVEQSSRRCKCFCLTALFYESIVLIAFFIVLIGLYFTSAKTNIPVNVLSYSLDDFQEDTYELNGATSPYSFILQYLPVQRWIQSKKNVHAVTSYISYNVSFPVYLISLCGWVGWWIFAVFAGVGFTSMPFDYINGFIHRPRVLAPDQLAQQEMELQERTSDLLDITVMLKRDRLLFIHNNPGRIEARKRFMADTLEVNNLAKMIYVLEQDAEQLRSCKNVRIDYNPLIPYVRLALGCATALISLVWLLQIILYVLVTPSITLFLNSYLKWFDTWFPMFGNLTYALLSLYLLLCTVKGCFKVGMRFLCVKIHPMEVGGTYINSFLFNLSLVLLCSIPTIHFCTDALAGYTSSSDAFFMFEVQIRNLHFFSIFYKREVFAWIILLTSLGTVPYFLMRPRDSATSPEEFKQSLYRRGAGYSVAGGSGPSGGRGRNGKAGATTAATAGSYTSVALSDPSTAKI